MSLTITTPGEKLADVVKPPLEVISKLVLKREDWLVVCAGFEERALSALKKAVSEQVPINVLIVLYEPTVQENRTTSIQELCHLGASSCIEVTYNRQEPSGFGNILAEMLANCHGRIFVDVSAMSRLLIVQSIVALRKRHKGFSDCFLIYTEARDYPPTQSEAKTELLKAGMDPTFSVLFLSSGVYEITVDTELSSFALASPQTRLVAFPSLDAHQLTALRAELQPSRFTFIEGLPPGQSNQWRKKLILDLNHLDQIRDAESYTVSTLNYIETLDCLLKIYYQHAIQERLIISPTGSKMQTVAVGIFRSLIEDVQIVYPTPRNFLAPDRYTIGVGPMYLLPLEIFSTEILCF